MKKILLAFVLSFGIVTVYAQTNQSGMFKYQTQAPDGSIAMTITDNTSEEKMKLESVDSFYKYEILDTRTSEPVFTSKNKGKTCEIDKTRLKKGTYNIRLYTSSFVITSKLTVSAINKLKNHKGSQLMAVNSDD